MSDQVSVVVPARNEASTIAGVVETLSRMDDVDEVVVVDNGSHDGTGAVATDAGARTVYEETPGMGCAFKAGILAARNDWIMKVDADLERFDTSLFAALPAARRSGVGLVKGVWNDPTDNMPMTRLLVMPAIKALAPGLSWLRAPNSGLYLFNRSLIAHQELVDDYAVDLDVMLRTYAAGAEIVEADIGRIIHDARDIGHYNAMAETIMAFFMRTRDKRINHEVVVMAQRAEQVIANSLGLIVARARAGAVVTVYLCDFSGVALGVLKTALAPFPTARIVALDQAGAFWPRAGTQHLRVIAPFPAADEDDAIKSALQLHGMTDKALTPSLLLMPMGPGRAGAVDSFKADTSFDSPDGATVKNRALAVLGLQPCGQNVREVFQTYASLPDALKTNLTAGGACTNAGNL